MTTNQTDELANVPHPAGAIRVDDWADVQHGHPSRYFVGTSWVVERNNRDNDLSVLVDGLQHRDGRVERLITIADGITEAVNDITLEQARQLARALIAAADECVTMNCYDKIEVNR